MRSRIFAYSSTRPFRSVFADSSSSSRMPWSSRAREMAASPVSASTRRVPAAMPCSAVTRKRPMSPVCRTCVPPQNSLEKPGISTTRTRSPYLSPKKARAP